METREITRRLNTALERTLVAALAGSRDANISETWARQDGPSLKPAAVRRLQFAYTQWLAIADAEGEQVAGMWFVGSNSLLDQSTRSTRSAKVNSCKQRQRQRQCLTAGSPGEPTVPSGCPMFCHSCCPPLQY
jgi:hypothetical protein